MPRPEPDKALGSLVGLAVCEALPADLKTVSHDAPLTPGLWGDGTSMALSLAESLIEMDGIDLRDQMVRYTSWFRYGYLSSTETCDFIDETVKQAILRFERTWNPRDEEKTEGDVCLARVAPLAIRFHASRGDMLAAVALSTETTHSAPESVDSCRLLALMISLAMDGAEKSDILAPQPQATLCPELAALGTNTAAQAFSPATRALKAAMTAFRDSQSFADGGIRCIPHGPRALAAYGQLAGAWYGLEGIPKAWRESLARNNLLIQMGNSLLGN